jgi:hypothetical protein
MDWDLPTLQTPLRNSNLDLLSTIKGRDTDNATMFDGTTAFSNLPTNAKRLTNQGGLSYWNGTTWTPFSIDVASGGTGANTASGARTSLSVYSKAEVDNLATQYPQKTLTISTTSPLHGGGDLSQNRTLSIQDGTTAQKGAVQLIDSSTSTSTTLAPTANALKLTMDVANEAKTTSSVLSATAGASAGGIGTYAFAWLNRSFNLVSFGDTVSGSELRPAGFSVVDGVILTQSFTIFPSDLSVLGSRGTNIGTLQGTWRCMGDYSGTYPHTLWLRIA